MVANLIDFFYLCDDKFYKWASMIQVRRTHTGNVVSTRGTFGRMTQGLRFCYANRTTTTTILILLHEQII